MGEGAPIGGQPRTRLDAVPAWAVAALDAVNTLLAAMAALLAVTADFAAAVAVCSVLPNPDPSLTIFPGLCHSPIGHIDQPCFWGSWTQCQASLMRAWFSR